MIRVIIADDHPIVREGLARLVGDEPEMSVVAEAGSGDELLRHLGEFGADVLLLDVSMPGPGVLETIRRVRAKLPELRVLVLSAHPEDQYAVRCLRAGAWGYLSKQRTGRELIEAIRRLHGGQHYVTDTLAEYLAAEISPDAERTPHELLSDREYQVLCLLGAGKSVQEASERLRLSPKTVSTYRARVLEKIGLATTAGLIRYAVEHGLHA